MDAWDIAIEQVKKHTTGNVFVRLNNDGESIKGVFCGKPKTREVHWTGERYEECSEKECPQCQLGKKPTFRVMMNFYAIDEESMKVIEGGSNWFKSLIVMKNKYSFADWAFEVQRFGEAKNSRTTYTILPEGKIDEALKAKIEQVPLHDLSALSGGKKGNEVENLIDSNDADNLILKLKDLPQDVVVDFLSQYNVKKVRDLKASDVSSVFDFLKHYEQSVEPTASVNPFD